MTKSVSILGLLCFFTATFTAAFAASASVPGLIREVDGKIFPKETFPASCKNFFQGVKCGFDSFGKYHLETRQEGELVYNRVTFTGPEGLQVIEQSWEKGGKVKKAIIENRALEKISKVEVKDGKVFYEVTDTKSHKVKKDDEAAVENLVVPSTIMTYIQPFSAQIARGEKVQIKVAVPDRLESFTFNIKKIKDDKTVGGEAIQVLEMAPASIIVRAVVDPMYFYVKASSGEMFAFEGESGLRRKVDGSWKKMQVRSEYEYRNAEPASSATASKAGCDVTDAISGKFPVKCEVKQ